MDTIRSAGVKVEPIDLPMPRNGCGFTVRNAGLLAHGVKNEPTLYIAPLASTASPSIPWKKLVVFDRRVAKSPRCTGDSRRGSLRGVAQRHAPRVLKILHVNLGATGHRARRSFWLCRSKKRRNQEDIAGAQDARSTSRELDGGIARLLRVPYGGKAEEISLPFYGNFDMQGADPRIARNLH